MRSPLAQWHESHASWLIGTDPILFLLSFCKISPIQEPFCKISQIQERSYSFNFFSRWIFDWLINCFVISVKCKQWKVYLHNHLPSDWLINRLFSDKCKQCVANHLGLIDRLNDWLFSDKCKQCVANHLAPDWLIDWLFSD